MGLTMFLSLAVESARCRAEWFDVALPLLGWGALGGLFGSLVSPPEYISRSIGVHLCPD